MYFGRRERAKCLGAFMRCVETLNIQGENIQGGHGCCIMNGVMKVANLEKRAAVTVRREKGGRSEVVQKEYRGIEQPYLLRTL